MRLIKKQQRVDSAKRNPKLSESAQSCAQLALKTAIEKQDASTKVQKNQKVSVQSTNVKHFDKL